MKPGIPGGDGSINWLDEDDLPDHLCAEGDMGCHETMDTSGSIDWLDTDELPDHLCSDGSWGCGHDDDDEDGDVVNIWNDLFNSASDLKALTAVGISCSVAIMSAF